MPLRIATYNVHGGVGLYRRYDPARIARVIVEMNADVVALQELQSRGDTDMLDVLSREARMQAIAAVTFRNARGDFGNGLLTRLPVVSSERIDLSILGREPRNAIDATMDYDGISLRIIATHFGLHASERREQSARLITAVKRHPELATILLGDINDWTLPRHAVRALHGHFGESEARGTYPSLLPAFALDRIWASAPSALVRVHAHRSRTARVASDHLPLVADLELSQPPEPAHTG
jgi:endonuclease/exonuclease/phosphatase family metal-dependent hydrolase